MDLEQPRQRSASQGSLNSTYRAQGRPHHYTHPRLPPPRRPLRSVDEATSMLRSPGPLESMLKTTTETGNIGVFSIKPAAPSVTYHHPPRPRPSFGDESLLRPHSRASNDSHFQDDRRRLPSYRDTTSEIISLYGSSMQQSYSRPFSPSLDDGRRSYSMTTCSSRHIPSNKSSCTLQSQSSSLGLQRPRSPFPYPTRLKRPGVRPASPAVTEDGGIDYSKMAELDRVSYRTVHGSYRPTYSQSYRRPPPLSLRSDFNRSTTSLPSRASPGPYYVGPEPTRVRTPNSSLSWTPRPPESQHQRGSADHSTRSASLTSIVEMYQRRAHPSRTGPPLRSTGSFYYDYTEEFETEHPQDAEIAAPLCPIPQRAGSLRRPMVLRDDSNAHLDAAESQIGPEDMHGEQKNEGNSPYPGVETEEDPPFDKDVNIMKLPDGHIEHKVANSNSDPAQPRTPTGSLSDIGDDVNNTVLRIRRGSSSSAPLPQEHMNDDHTEASQSSLARIRWTLHPGVPEFNSLKITFDKLAKSPFQKKGDITSSNLNSSNEQEKQKLENQESSTNSPPKYRAPLAQTDENETEPASESFRRRHRRHPAATNISTTDSSDSHLTSLKQMGSSGHTHILSPNPVSPALQLKLSNSIPQLMKTLAPLPGAIDAVYDSLDDDNSSGTDIPTQLLFTSPPKPSVTFTCHADSLVLVPKIPPGVERSEPPKTIPRTSPSKLKLGVKPPCSPVLQDSDIPERTSSNTPKLKMKVSKTRLGMGDVQNGPATRLTGLKQRNSVWKLNHCPKIEFLTTTCSLEEAIYGQTTEFGFQPGGLKVIDESVSGPGLLPCPSDQFDLAYPTPTTNMGPDIGANHPTLNAPLNDTQSLIPRVSLNGYKGGLRQKLSLLRLRSAGSGASVPRSRRHREVSSPVGSHRIPEASYMNFDNPVSSCGVRIRKDRRGMSARSDKRGGGRVRRWAVEAKRAVRSCVRRTLDRSSSSGD
ncbi:Fc.00g062430.m01.CDS01 [Cosmosporella sp. VM-42]